MRYRLLVTTLAFTPAVACSSASDTGDGIAEGGEADGADDGMNSEDFPLHACADVEGACIEVASGDSDDLQSVVNLLEDDTTVILGKGVYVLDNQVTIRANGITFWGQGKGTEGSFDEGTILDYETQTTQSNGVDVVGDRFTIADLAIVDAKKDGLRIEDSDQVTIQRVRATWRAEGSTDNGAYGLYPVKVSRVLMEDSEAFNSSDAGIYVGQCQHAVIRNNLAMGNVAGIEIENTQFADVYGNYAEDNTGGLVIFDLPGNPIVGRDVSVHDNTVVNNNRTNFAPQGSTVAAIPPGTGTFAMASRRVEIFNNTYESNNSFDIAVISGLPIEGDPEKWKLSKTELVGDVTGLNLLEDDTGEFVYNYRSDNAYVHGNTHTNTGTGAPNTTLDQELGVLLQIVYGAEPIDAVLYDTWSESSFDANDPALNSNDNHICIGDTAADGATFASLNMEVLIPNGGVVADLFRPAEPYAPFDCDTFVAGPIQPPVID